MSRHQFGWDYPPGVSSVPGDEAATCEVCGGDAENSGEPGGCVCYLLTKPLAKDSEAGKELGSLKTLSRSDLSTLRARFEFVASNLRAEAKRRFDEAPTECCICKRPMTFEEVEEQEVNCHATCSEKIEEDAERYENKMEGYFRDGEGEKQ